MKRIMFDVPDMTTLFTITYIYNDEKTYELMAGLAVVTNADNPSVMKGEEPYIVRESDRRSDNKKGDI